MPCILPRESSLLTGARIAQRADHSRPKWGVNPNLRVLGQDAYPLKALPMGY